MVNRTHERSLSHSYHGCPSSSRVLLSRSMSSAAIMVQRCAGDLNGWPLARWKLAKHHVAPSISTTIAWCAHPLCLSAGEGRERDLQVVRWGGNAPRCGKQAREAPPAQTGGNFPAESFPGACALKFLPFGCGEGPKPVAVPHHDQLPPVVIGPGDLGSVSSAFSI